MSERGFVGAPEKPIFLVLQMLDSTVGVALIRASASGLLKARRWTCRRSARRDFSNVPALLSMISRMTGSQSSPSWLSDGRRVEGAQMLTMCSTSSSCFMTELSFRTPTPTVLSAVWVTCPSSDARPVLELAVLGGAPSLLSAPAVTGDVASSGCSDSESRRGLPLEKADRVLLPAHIRLLRTDLFPADSGGFEWSFENCGRACDMVPDRELGLVATTCCEARILTTKNKSDSGEEASPISAAVRSAKRVRICRFLARWTICPPAGISTM